MNKLFILLLVGMVYQQAHAQLPDGSIAPDFTLTDYDGVSHNLYTYLDSGKTVFIEIFAAHCPSCWNYHQTNRMKNLYNSYGPNGTDEVMVMALEHDQWNNNNAFIGNGPAWVTQGNWLAGTPYPIFDVEDPDRVVFSDYNINFYPLVLKICPDRILERVATSETETQLYQRVQNCQTALSIDEVAPYESVYINQSAKTLVVEAYELIDAINVLNLQGQTVKQFGSLSSSSLSLAELPAGIYLFQLLSADDESVRKLIVQ